MTNFLPPSYIRTIEIEDLFGESNIRIERSPSADPRVIVLYGKNGTGKTTILKIITSLLSAETNSGHRSRLANIPFSRASITLDGGVQVEAKKKEGILGAFDWTLRKPNSQISIHIKATGRNGRVRVSDWPPEIQARYQQITEEIHSIIPQVVFLDDKRTFYVEDARVRSAHMRGVDTDDLHQDEDPVHEGLRAITNSVRREALILSNRGNQTAQSIYTSLVRGVSAFPQTEPAAAAELQARLVDLEMKSKRLSAYGLVAVAEHGELLSALEAADDRALPLVKAVLDPYVKSLSARLSAIEALHNHLHAWVTNINTFIEPKVLSFRIGEEIDIKKDGKSPIPVHLLSSGERHLLLLMTRAFHLRTTGGLMIVDEPELSLNSGWQRGLIAGLVDGFGSAPCQMVVASHSLEICSQYQNQVAFI